MSKAKDFLPRVVITHDYLMQYGGAEKVLESLHQIWPAAPIYTTFYDRSGMRDRGLRIPARAIHALLPTSVPHQGLGAKAWTFLYPALWRSLDLSSFDLVVSSSSFAAHHARARASAVHLCYCHTPARFLYGLPTDLDHDRLRRILPFLPAAYDRLRRLDQAAAARVTAYAANSAEVRDRIARCYGRTAMVIAPPVDTDAFASPPGVERGPYVLAYGRLVASKRFDLAIAAASLAGVPLVIAGEGPEGVALARLAGPTTRFVGWQKPKQLRALIAAAAAVLFPSDEDFGIVPLEAMAAGTPVLAYRHGGALETVVEGVTGEFFAPHTADALGELLARFDGSRYAPEACRERAAEFSHAAFARHIRHLAEDLISGSLASSPGIG